MTAALPQAFVAEMAEQLGAELPAFLRSYEEPARRGLRLNPLKPLTDTAMAAGSSPPRSRPIGALMVLRMSSL